MSPVVFTVVVTMLPAVFTGTVTKEQPVMLMHIAGRMRRKFMRWV